MDIILQQSINDCLNCNMLSNALFLTERLLAYSDSDENHYLLASIYYRQGRLAQAHSVLKKLHYLSGTIPNTNSNNSNNQPIIKSLQLLAQCCLEMGEIMEAEYLLEESLKLINESNSNNDSSIGLNSSKLSISTNTAAMSSIDPCQIATIHYLLGLAYRQLNKKNEAIVQLQLALEIFPYLWVAYEQLCQLDFNKVNPTDIYNINNVQKYEILKMNNSQFNNNNSNSNQRIRFKNIKNDKVNSSSLKNNNNNQVKSTTSSGVHQQQEHNAGFDSFYANSVGENYNFEKLISGAASSMNNNNITNNNNNNNTTNNNTNMSVSMGDASTLSNISHINQTPHLSQINHHFAPRKSVQSQIQFESFSSSVGGNLGGLNFEMTTPQQLVTPKFNLMNNLNSNNTNNTNSNITNSSISTQNNNNHLFVTPIMPKNKFQQPQSQQHSTHHSHHHSHHGHSITQQSPIPMSFTTPATSQNNINNNLFANFSTPAMSPSPVSKPLPEVIKKKALNFDDNESETGGIPFISQQLLFESQIQQQQKTINNNLEHTEKKKKLDNNNINTKNDNNNKIEKHVHIGGIQEIYLDNNSLAVSAVGKPMTLDDIVDINSINNINYESVNDSESSLSTLQYLAEMEVSHKELLSIFINIATSYKYLFLYKCKESIDYLYKLPESQRNTGWVLTQIAKAYFEMVDYNQAATIFEQIRLIEPYRLDGVEIYSTVLWHLKKVGELGYLANELLEFDRLSANVWCVVGNSFSLQKDHEASLKTFKRAIQLNPKLTYAYTLCGHEYLANDDLDNAQKYYRSAIKLDAKHYNAWYGLGLVYFRQEKYNIAEYHFRKALSINKTSSVLYCYIGMTLQSMKRFEEALIELQHALDLAPRNTLAKYKKATILFTMEQYHLALTELEEFKEIAPKEISIYILMGKIYKRLGQLEKANDCLSIALDMAPENSNYVRIIIDKLFLEDDRDNNPDFSILG